MQPLGTVHRFSQRWISQQPKANRHGSPDNQRRASGIILCLHPSSTQCRCSLCNGSSRGHRNGEVSIPVARATRTANVAITGPVAIAVAGTVAGLRSLAGGESARGADANHVTPVARAVGRGPDVAASVVQSRVPCHEILPRRGGAAIGPDGDGHAVVSLINHVCGLAPVRQTKFQADVRSTAIQELRINVVKGG